MEKDIAKIVVNTETRQIVDVAFYKRNLRFKCQRCATFCCKLGGPNLTERDVQRIIKAGYAIENFLESTTKMKNNNSEPKMQSRLRERDDGSCIFLRFNGESRIYECSIYDVRPVLCRIYPFDFERINSNSLMLRFIPCCKGLNSPDGELVDERFISNHLLDAIFGIS